MPRAYGKRYRKRTTASAVSKVARRRPTASNQKSQIMSLSKRVNTLSRKVNSGIEQVFYQTTWDQTVSSNYAIFPLVKPASWTNVFGQSDNVTESRKLTIKKMNLDFDVTPYTEGAEVDFTVFLASCKNNKSFRETNGMTTIAIGNDDYVINNGLALLNPKRFNIHKAWRLKTSGVYTDLNGTTTLNTLQSARRYHKMYMNHQLRNAQGAPWTSIADNEIPIGASYALIVFNNNSAVDLESPQCKGFAHFTCYA